MDKEFIREFDQYLDDESEDCVVEIKESEKIGKKEKSKWR
jgi:hypothetical protein